MSEGRIANAMHDLRMTNFFPLQTIQSLSERWGVTKHVVANWARRHDNFPKPLEGVIAETKGAPKLYPLYEVEKYEREKGLKVETDAEQEARIALEKKWLNK